MTNDESGSGAAFRDSGVTDGGESRARPTAEFVARSLLVGVMAGALIAALAGVGRLIVPQWQSTFLVLYCTLVAIEAQWSHWLLTERLLQSFDRVWFRVAEIGVLIILGHVGDAALGGRAGGLGGITSLDLRAVFMAVLVLIAWGASTTTASEFARLGEHPERDATYVPPLEGLTRRFFVGGALLLAAVGLTQIEVRRLLDTTRPPVTGPILSALVYFALGMVLLALAQHSLLRRRWQDDGVAVAAGLGGRWARFSLSLMILTALIAFILPTAYGGGLLDLLALVLTGVIYILTLLGIGFVAPFAWLLSLLTGGSPSTAPESPAMPPPPPPPPPAPVGDGPPWLDILRWTVFAVIGIVLAYWLLRGWLENRALLGQGIGTLRPLALLRAFFVALWHRLRGYAAAIGERLPTLRRSRSEREGSGGSGARLRLPGARTPREQVVRYYLSLVRRASSQGLPRRPAQTPEEYAASLRPRLPDAQPDLTALTDAFVEARYSRHDVSTDESRQARGNWERLRDALRLWQRQQEADEKAEGREVS